MKKLPLYRYYLEMIAVPVFAWLVIHLAGHALMLVADPEHNHDDHAPKHQVEAEHHNDHEETTQDVHEGDHDDPTTDEHEGEEHEGEPEPHDDETGHDDHEEATHTESAGHDDHAGQGHGEGLSLKYLLSTEVLGGVLALIFFVWIWHLPFMKPLVPCSHDHCHHKTIWPHVAATVAFVFHWFPEAQIRYEIMKDFSHVNWLDIAAVIGFSTHFLVDAIILALLASFWPQLWQKLSVGVTLVALWAFSFWVGHHGGLHLEGAAEPIVLLVSAFLLAMFVHKPHKPEPECRSCSS